jgi:hypothetical protein
MRKKQQLIRCQRTVLSSTIEASNRRVGGLVGSCVGGLVGEMVKGIGTGHIRVFSPRQNQLLFFEMEWKRVTGAISTTNVQYSI